MIIRQYLWLLLCGFIFSLVSGNTFAAISRHALVIGNSNYQEAYLSNPENDARDVAKSLQKLNYKLYENKAHINRDIEQMEDLVTGFSASLPRDAIAVVYFAGHGVSSNRESYLIPINARITKESQVRHRALSLSYLLDELKQGNNKGLNVVLLDACRNNPFGSQFRSSSRGLSRPARLAQGTFVGMSAGEGQVASDGNGRNGLYTTHLLAALEKHSGKSIEQVHKIIARAVYDETAKSENPQSPIYQSDVFGEYCFGICSSGEVIVNIDTIPPTLSHTPLQDDIHSDESQTISAQIKDETALDEASVFYQSEGMKDYTRLKLSAVDGTDYYIAQLPASAIKPPLVQYFMEARDKAGNISTQGTKEQPLSLRVTVPIQPLPVVDSPPSIQPPEALSQKSSRKWLWIGLGVLATGALLNDPGDDSKPETVTLTIGTSTP